MHIHGNLIDINVASLSSAVKAKKAAAKQRAADARRKLMQRTTDIDGISSPDEAYLVSKWMDPLRSQAQEQKQDEYHSGSAGKDFDLG
jgi:hypothetical protein